MGAVTESSQNRFSIHPTATPGHTSMTDRQTDRPHYYG